MNRIVKTALFPAILTLFFFISFIVLYLMVIRMPIEPFYLRGLLFGVPFLCFVLITALALACKLGNAASIAVSLTMLVLSVMFSVGLVFYLATEASTTKTTDIQYYEKALTATQYPNHPAVSFFPQTIPEGAQDVRFSYHPTIWQGGESLCLQYTLTAEQVDRYAAQFSNAAKWVGSPANVEREKTGIHEGSLFVLDYEDALPSDLSIYLMYSRPYQNQDWNHGELGLVTISKRNNQITYSFEDW